MSSPDHPPPAQGGEQGPAADNGTLPVTPPPLTNGHSASSCNYHTQTGPGELTSWVWGCEAVRLDDESDADAPYDDDELSDICASKTSR